MTLPAIAAAMDFMNSKFIGEILRQCGAFFIRRAVGEDILYWALFSEYVQTHIVEGDRPVEFFIEGTRSRTNKSLPPKYGLLQILLEPYLRGNVYDMVVVPVTMQYDKILEEALYAHELLGFPKPKESTSGLLKARSILHRRFGRVQVTFSNPISIRDHLGVSIKRGAFVCQPDSQWKMSEMEKKVIRRFGHYIILKHYDHIKVTVWSIASSALLLLFAERREKSVELGSLLKLTHELATLLRALRIDVSVRKSIREDLEAALTLHADFIAVDGDIKESASAVRLMALPVDGRQGQISSAILSEAVTLIILTNHANASMHRLSGPSLFSIVLLSSASLAIVKERYKWLRGVLYSEFVHDPQDVDGEFDRILETFTSARLVDPCEPVQLSNAAAIQVFAQLSKPYLLVFSVMIDVLLETMPLHTTQKEATARAQQKLIRLHDRDAAVLLSCLSADMLRNTFNTLTQQGALVKKCLNFSINSSILLSFKDKLGYLFDFSYRSSKL